MKLGTGSSTESWSKLEKGGVLPYFNTKEDLTCKSPFEKNLLPIISVIRKSLLETVIDKNSFGKLIWLGYRKKNPRKSQTMFNVYTQASTMIQPYQNDKGQNCAGTYSIFYRKCQVYARRVLK